MSSLKDFLRELQQQEDTDVVYSKADEDGIRIIPPESVFEEKEETRIKLDFKLPKEEPKVEEKVVKNFIESVTKEASSIKSTEIKQSQAKIDRREKLFQLSGTDESLKDKWFEYYDSYQNTRERNSIAYGIRDGRFRLAKIQVEDEKTKISTTKIETYILPKYTGIDKSVKDILKDRWL